jgi:FemAB-related protein (PEP-CTERM system-associated)
MASTFNIFASTVTETAPTVAPVSVQPYRDWDRDRWDAFVRREPSASFFHLSGWMRVMVRTFNYQCCALYAERNGELTGVLPLFSIKNWILGRCLISTPFAVYGGIAASDEQSYVALLERAKQMAENQQVQYLELRNRSGEVEPGFRPIIRYVTFTGALSADSDANLKRLPRDTRYMIRKAQKMGLAVHHGTDRLAEFHSLMSLSLKRLGTPMFPWSLFTNLIEEFPDETELLMVSSGAHPVSGVFSFTFRDTVLPYYSGASADAPLLAANNLMYWELMKWAADRGFRSFDFGRSKTGTGAYSFKAQWNMEIIPLRYQVFLVKKKTLPDFSPANCRFEHATRMWSRLPLWMTRQAGPHIVRWFP